MEEGFVEEFHLVDSSSFFCCVWKGGKGKEREGKGRERSKFSGKGSGGRRRKEKEENSAVQEGLQRTDRTGEGEADSTQKEEHTRGNKRKELPPPPFVQY